MRISSGKALIGMREFRTYCNVLRTPGRSLHAALICERMDQIAGILRETFNSHPPCWVVL